MFTILWLADARRQYEIIRQAALTAQATRKKSMKSKSSKQEGLFKQVFKCIDHLSQNPRHPGLETHPYDSLDHPFSDTEQVFEAYVQNNTSGAYRVFWCYGPKKQEITIIALTPHP